MAFIYYADDEQEIRDVVSSFLISEGHSGKYRGSGTVELE